LKHDVMLLLPAHRTVVEDQCELHCNHRKWHLWAASARSNHVHVVVTAVDCSGSKVRDQLKANCTRSLRERWTAFCDRPVWTVGGDWQCINDEKDLDRVCAYVCEAQDRMAYEFPRRTGR
jgi:REP element-mobilizing transposase RayT